MRKFHKYILVAIAAVTGSYSAMADEGMWMIHAIDAALEKKMQERGLELSVNEIYNADAPGAAVSDAVVSMEFGCTGSIISDEGLLITNHHCAYSDIHALSTPEHNYLEEGFWAFRSDEEVNIKDKSVYFLKRVIDVTEDVEELKAELIEQGMNPGMRKLSYILEKEWKEETGMDAWLASMWKGTKYYMALYEVYSDVRLVAAPPVSSAAFGGDVDNWEWPQHKCDFAMYRVYTAPDGSPAKYSSENIPLKPARKLEISLDGYQEGDYTMIIGYPGRTNRYSSSYEVDFNETLKHPISNRIRGDQMAVIKSWMDKDPDIRLKYADYYFSLSNVQELYSGEVECFNRFDVVEKKAEEEKDMPQELLNKLKSTYDALREPERNAVYYRETIIRGTRLGLIMRRAHNARNQTQLRIARDYEEIDLRVEEDLMAYSISEYINNIDPVYFSPWQKELIKQFTTDGVCDTEALADHLWNNSIFTSEEGIERLLKHEVPQDEVVSDPLCRFIMDVKITAFNEVKQQVEGEETLVNLTSEYARALYQMRDGKGLAQYPDANSTMRITYGAVGGIKPRDCIMKDWKTTPAGILEKYDPTDYDFTLSDRQYLLYRAGNWGRWGFGPDNSLMYVNFLTDNDITGGNSGSPVLNSRGQLIGLAFDGNKESLASDAMYVPGYNKCVCVDIRFILWTLDRYAGLTRIIEELGL